MQKDERRVRCKRICTIIFPGHMVWGGDVVELGSSLTLGQADGRCLRRSHETPPRDETSALVKLGNRGKLIAVDSCSQPRPLVNAKALILKAKGWQDRLR